MRYAVVVQDGLVENVVLWDGIAEWAPPEGAVAILVEDGQPAEPGGTYLDGAFTPAPRPKPPSEDDQEQLLAIVTNALLTVPEVQQALAQAGVEVERDEKGNPIGIKVPEIKEAGEIGVDDGLTDLG